jgi:hypothetical protein
MKPWVLVAFVLLILALDVRADDVTLLKPANGDTCVTGQTVNFSYQPNIPAATAVNNCYLYVNDTGTWHIQDFNSSAVGNQVNYFYNQQLSAGMVMWGVRCVNSSLNDVFSAANYNFTLKNVAYCAVLSPAVCPKDPNVNSMAVGSTRLGNSRGFWLENQDANVYITNSRGTTVKAFDTMTVSQEITLVLDKNGNWLNTLDKKVPLTDSAGYYVFPFLVDRDWAWVGDEYTLNFNVNGETVSCKFNVTKDRLPDMNNYQQLGVDASGVILLILILLYLIWRYGSAVRRGVWG